MGSVKDVLVEQVMETLQISDEKLANFNSGEDEWKKRRVVEAQLKVLANYSQCRYRVTTLDNPTFRELALAHRDAREVATAS